MELLTEKEVASPARVIDTALKENPRNEKLKEQGQKSLFNEPNPWPDEVDGSQLLTEIVGIIRKYIVMANDESFHAAALWVIFTHTFDAFSLCPRLGIVSPEKRCGKTSLLTLLSGLVAKTLYCSNITPAAVFRAIEEYRPTMLIDEGHTFLKDNEELRGIVNSGHAKRTAAVIRTVGDNHEPKKFSTWAPVAIALIGDLPGKIEDRSVLITMRRRASGETVERLRGDRIDEICREAKQKCIRWSQDNFDKLQNIDPDAPNGLHDRAADNWRPLLSVADLAGGDWPALAKKAAVVLSERGEDDLAIKEVLLADIRKLFSEFNEDKLPSRVIVDNLCEMEEQPWNEWKRGKPMTTGSLSKLLKPFGIKSENIRYLGEVAKGYKKANFEDVWSRYLARNDNLPATPLQPNKNKELHDDSFATQPSDVALRSATQPSDVAGKFSKKTKNG